MQNNRHIEQAKDFLRLAEAEFEQAKRKNDMKLLQDACAKGWFATVEATYALLVNKGIKEKELPKTDRGRGYMITRYGDRELRWCYFNLRDRLHIDGYYDCILTFDDFKLQLDDLRFYMKRIEEEK